MAGPFKMKAGKSPMKYFWEKKNVREARKEGKKSVKSTKATARRLYKEGKIDKDAKKQAIKKSKLEKKQLILDARKENI